MAGLAPIKPGMGGPVSAVLLGAYIGSDPSVNKPSPRARLAGLAVAQILGSSWAYSRCALLALLRLKRSYCVMLRKTQPPAHVNDRNAQTLGSIVLML